MNSQYQLVTAQLNDSTKGGSLLSKPSTALTQPFAVAVSGNEVKENTIEGDLVLGLQLKLSPQARDPNALMALLERSRQLTEESPEYRAMIEELQSFLAQRPGRRVIGLEAKLNDGNRPDLIDDALWLENRFARRLAKEQLSPSLQALFLHCLSQINTAFCAHIHPLIRSGVSPAAVDASVKVLVLDPLHSEIMQVDCSITAESLRGMLYFLTGKCHLQWK